MKDIGCEEQLLWQKVNITKLQLSLWSLAALEAESPKRSLSSNLDLGFPSLAKQTEVFKLIKVLGRGAHYCSWPKLWKQPRPNYHCSKTFTSCEQPWWNGFLLAMLLCLFAESPKTVPKLIVRNKLWTCSFAWAVAEYSQNTQRFAIQISIVQPQNFKTTNVKDKDTE